MNSTQLTDKELTTILLRNWERSVRILRDELSRELTDEPHGADIITSAVSALTVLVDEYEVAHVPGSGPNKLEAGGEGTVR